MRRHAPAPPPRGQPAPAADTASAFAPPGKWKGRIVAGIALAVFSVFILCIANIVVAFPWLSVLLGLPLALYAKYKKS